MSNKVDINFVLTECTKIYEGYIKNGRIYEAYDKEGNFIQTGSSIEEITIIILFFSSYIVLE